MNKKFCLRTAKAVRKLDKWTLLSLNKYFNAMNNVDYIILPSVNVPHVNFHTVMQKYLKRIKQRCANILLFVSTFYCMHYEFNSNPVLMLLQKKCQQGKMNFNDTRLVRDGGRECLTIDHPS